MGPLRPFFPLTKTFFGLTYEYKKGLFDEIFVCTKGLATTREDILMMPTHERRYYLSLLKGLKEDAEENKSNQNNITYNGKGNRIRTVSGLSLKQQIQSGQIPNT